MGQYFLHLWKYWEDFVKWKIYFGHISTKTQTLPVAACNKQPQSELLPPQSNNIIQWAGTVGGRLTWTQCHGAPLGGTDSCQVIVITQRMNMVVIGRIKLGHRNDRPWSRERWQMPTRLVMMMMMMMLGSSMQDFITISLPCKVLMKITIQVCFNKALFGHQIPTVK